MTFRKTFTLILGATLLAGALYAFQRPFHVYRAAEGYDDLPLPPDYKSKVFALFLGYSQELVQKPNLIWRNTISWEVVTALSARLTRVYHAAAGPVRP